jgi:hypothetical protein
MNGWRNAGIVLVLLAMLAWSVYIAFWQLTLGVPPIEGAAEQEAWLRLTILVIWLIGLAVGVVALVGLSRRTFDSVPPARRRKLAIGGYAIGGLIVIGLAWFNLIYLLVFGWIPLAAALLLLTAWASPPEMRSRLGLAVLGWAVGVSAVGMAWFFATDLMRDVVWLAWAVVTVVAAAWWALAPVRPAQTTWR